MLTPGGRRRMITASTHHRPEHGLGRQTYQTADVDASHPSDEGPEAPGVGTCSATFERLYRVVAKFWTQARLPVLAE